MNDFMRGHWRYADFGDGNGPVPAHKHENGGGWVANTATVQASAYIGRDARVYGYAPNKEDVENAD